MEGEPGVSLSVELPDVRVPKTRLPWVNFASVAVVPDPPFPGRGIVFLCPLITKAWLDRVENHWLGVELRCGVQIAVLEHVRVCKPKSRELVALHYCRRACLDAVGVHPKHVDEVHAIEALRTIRLAAELDDCNKCAFCWLVA